MSVGENIPIFDTNTIKSDPPADTRTNPSDVDAAHQSAAHHSDNVPHQNVPHQNPVDHDHVTQPNIATIPTIPVKQ